MIDAVFYETFKEEEQRLKQYLPKKLNASFSPKTIQESGDKTMPAPLISIRTQSHIPTDWSGELKGILTRSTGFDHLIAYRRQTQTPAALGALPEYCSRAVAEQAVLMTLALARKLKLQVRQFDQFCREGMTGQESPGKNLFVIGVGRIGREVVSLAQGMGMNVKGFDKNKTLKNFEYVTLDEGMSWAHYIVCALSLNDETRGLINYEAFQSARSPFVFVNIARGEISPAEGLKRLLDENRCAGLGLDVFEDEAALAGALRGSAAGGGKAVEIFKEIKDRDNVLFTPHNAFNTAESVEKKARLSAESIEGFLKRSTFPFPVPGEDTDT